VAGTRTCRANARPWWFGRVATISRSPAVPMSLRA